MQKITDEIMYDFLDIASRLDPAALDCDGEASAEEVLENFTYLTQAWKDLEQKNGITISQKAVWNWYYEIENAHNSKTNSEITSTIKKSI